MKNTFRKLFFTLILITAPSPSGAVEGWRVKFPDLSLVGSGILKVFFMDVYKLRLYSANGHYSHTEDFALEFEYLRPVSGSTIVNASITELSNLYNVTFEQKKLWRKILNRGISDMDSGETAAVIFLKTGSVEFFSNSKAQGSFNSPIFKKYFSSIWLGKNTSHPDLRRKLLGQ